MSGTHQKPRTVHPPFSTTADVLLIAVHCPTAVIRSFVPLSRKGGHYVLSLQSHRAGRRDSTSVYSTAISQITSIVEKTFHLNSVKDHFQCSTPVRCFEIGVPPNKNQPRSCLDSNSYNPNDDNVSRLFAPRLKDNSMLRCEGEKLHF